MTDPVDSSDSSDSNSSSTSGGLEKGELRLMWGNTCGLDSLKWQNLEAIADEAEIDLVMVQEGAAAKEANKFIDAKKWDCTFASEKPTDLQMPGSSLRATPSATSARTYMIAKRKRAARLHISAHPYLPTSSKKVLEYIQELSGADKQVTTKRSGRISGRKVTQQAVNQLGHRAPQKVSLSLPGYDPVKLYNFHAPQGGGSKLGFSGMDAAPGHEILSREMEDDNSPQKMLVGDMNAQRTPMRNFYTNSSVLSVGTSDPLIHGVFSRGLQPEPLDLGDKGSAFKSKGKPGHGDHALQAAKIRLSKSKF